MWKEASEINLQEVIKFLPLELCCRYHWHLSKWLTESPTGQYVWQSKDACCSFYSGMFRIFLSIPSEQEPFKSQNHLCYKMNKQANRTLLVVSVSGLHEHSPGRMRVSSCQIWNGKAHLLRLIKGLPKQAYNCTQTETFVSRHRQS